MKDKTKTHAITIRLPHDLWLAVRRLEENGIVRSIQDAAVKGIMLQVHKFEESQKY